MNTRILTLTLLAAASIQLSASAQIVFLQDNSEQTTAAPFGHGGVNCVVSGEYAFVGGGRSNDAFDAYSVIGGGDGNTAGTDNDIDEAFYSTVIGGQFNMATSTWAMVGGGYSNETSGAAAVVNGGRENVASGIYSVVLGGYLNEVSGSYSVAGGRQCTASGDYSMVIGRSGTDGGNDYSFVWAGASGNRNSGGQDTFNVWSSGGIYFNGAVAHASDRNMKQDFAPINTRDILEKVATLPVPTWRFKSEPEDIQHIGPMSQDFHETFGYNGNDDTHIAATDADGVSIAAIQGAYQKLIAQEVSTQNAVKRAQAIEARLTALETQQ